MMKAERDGTGKAKPVRKSRRGSKDETQSNPNGAELKEQGSREGEEGPEDPTNRAEGQNINTLTIIIAITDTIN
jgi:hypothetical protein